MAGARFLDLVKPFASYLPEVAAPQRKVPFNQKIMWTAVVLLMFLVMGEIPLYGIVSSDSSDPLMWLRMMLASNRGTLMELGITPIVTSSMVLQLLVGTGVIEVGEEKRDRELLQTAQKLLAVIMCTGQGVVYVLTGMYGLPSSLGLGVCSLLVIQLVVAGLVVILLDELLQKGYGLGSGTSLFSSTNICEQVLWKSFSPNTVNTGRGYEFEGAIVALVHLVATRRDKRAALIEAFTRSAQPNVSQVIVTVVMFLTVVYMSTLVLNLPVRSVKSQSAMATFPVRLFYTANTPVMLQGALVSNVFLISQQVFTRYPNSLLTRVFGVWDVNRLTGALHAVGGIAYYLQPPVDFAELRRDPIKLVVYVVFVSAACAVFSRTWADISNMSAKDVARQLREQGLGLVGVRETSTYRELKRIIPTAAALGGVSIGLLAVSSDLLGTLVPGSSILLAVTTIFSYYEAAVKEGALTPSA